jgi:predicted metal-binding protein
MPIFYDEEKDSFVAKDMTEKEADALLKLGTFYLTTRMGVSMVESIAETFHDVPDLKDIPDEQMFRD